MGRLCIAAAAIAAVISTELVHGVWTGRWELTDEPGASAARLQTVAPQLGDWQGEPVAVDARQREHVSGYLCRSYVNRSSGSRVTVFLVCGRPGPVAIHPPDVCYRASGYQVQAPVRCTVPLGGPLPDPEFWTAQMLKKKSADQTRLRVFWSWSAAGSWTVPGDPRLAFAHYPVLFKLYLIRDLGSAEESLADDPCVALMHELLPELQRVLFSRS